MAKEGSIAPKERVNIRYKPATGDQKEEVELPNKLMMLGDYTLREDQTDLESRRAIEIDKDNFDKVLKEQQLSIDVSVKDKIRDDAGDDDMISTKLKFESMKDFEPDAIIQQVPELKKMLDLRDALISLKGPLSNKKDFRKKIEAMMDDEEKRKQLLDDLGIGEE